MKSVNYKKRGRKRALKMITGIPHEEYVWAMAYLMEWERRKVFQEDRIIDLMQKIIEIRANDHPLMTKESDNEN